VSIIMTPPIFEDELSRIVGLANYRQSISDPVKIRQITDEISFITARLKKNYLQVYEEWYESKRWGQF
jgi:hypothetical protein